MSPRGDNSVEVPDRPRFLVDIMLGKLSKWLRILGYDTVYEHLDDQLVLERLRHEGRILLSRDRELVSLAGEGNAYYVRSQTPARQVAEVVRAFNLDPERYFFSRCSLCNVPVRAVPKEVVEGQIPEYVRQTQQGFWQCPACGQVYWKGSHFERAKGWLRRALTDAQE
ncbi:MAG: Mut7-C RNAse domain-containing protein [candidate division KSB1 bacterium]|nr:Mut7-C RNAse domain-containing protein [candidate division KSB1 bacterium]